MKKRLISTLTATFAIALGVTACSTADPEGAGVSEDWKIPEEAPEATIRVLTPIDPEADNFKPIYEAFAEAYPSITVVHESVPFDQVNSILAARMGNKDANPDVFWADQPRLPAFAERGYAADITEQFDEYKDMWIESAYDSSTYNERLWGVPLNTSTQLLFYNKDILDDADVAYPASEPDERITWEELAEDAARVVESDSNLNGMVFGQVDRYYQLQPLVVSLGGSDGVTGEENLTPDVTSDEWIEAMDWYGSVFEKGLSNRGVPADQSDADFLAGNTAFLVQSEYLLRDLHDSDLNWGVAPFPRFANGEAVTPTGSWAMSLNPFSEEKEAASLFMRWMSVEGGKGGYTTHRVDAPLPATHDGLADYANVDALFGSDEGQVAASIIQYETTNTAHARAKTVGYLEFEDIIGRAFSDIRNGSPAQNALETAEQELESEWSIKYQ